MNSIKRLLTLFIFMALMPTGIFAQDQKVTEEQEIPKDTLSIVRVNAINVCMGMETNKLFSKELMPAVVDGKTYYGCCGGCQSKLLEDPKTRVAIDPISGKQVDKATAVIGALPSGVVHYFESEENMNQFGKIIQSKE